MAVEPEARRVFTLQGRDRPCQATAARHTAQQLHGGRQDEMDCSDGSAQLHQGLSYRALITQRSVAMCCCLVDSILRLPRPSSRRPQVNRYRRSWHCLAGLLCCLVVLTAAQSCASGVGYAVCSGQLAGCVTYLQRDPCLKAAVPFFVVTLVWLSIFCSCCCQSPKALSVFLLVGLCGEAVLASYMVAFDQTVRIDDHLRAQLKESLDAECAGRTLTPDAEAAVRCLRPLRGGISSCRKLASSLPRLCSRTTATAGRSRGQQKPQDQSQLPPPALALAFHVDSCIADLLETITVKKQLHQSVTYSLLFLFAGLHFLLAVAFCGYDVQRKRMEKNLLLQDMADKAAPHGNGQLRQLEIHVNMDARTDAVQQQKQPPPPPPPRLPLPTAAGAAGQTLPLLTSAGRPSCGRVTFDMDKRM